MHSDFLLNFDAAFVIVTIALLLIVLIINAVVFHERPNFRETMTCVIGYLLSYGMIAVATFAYYTL